MVCLPFPTLFTKFFMFRRVLLFVLTNLAVILMASIIFMIIENVFEYMEKPIKNQISEKKNLPWLGLEPPKTYFGEG